MFKNIPFSKVDWSTSAFLIGTFFLSLTAVPWYIVTQGLDWFTVGLFLAFFFATGISVTLGYHRLFSHLAFKAKWPVRLFTLLFGAAAFENSVLDWSCDHRRHHKHCDHDDDPYDISKGFLWAHIGWLMFRLAPEPPRDNIKDLEKDPLVVWQDKYVHLLAVLVGLVLPAAIAGLWYGSWMGALGGFLIAGILRIVAVHHATFFINSLCHTLGERRYDTKVSARDSWLMAIFTFGEGYHNYHHTFQHDYRNGIKPWHIDPTKWTIWVLHKLGLVSDLRTVPDEKILLAELKALQERVAEKEAAAPKHPKLVELREKLTEAAQHLNELVRQRVALTADQLRKIHQVRDEVLETLAKLKAPLGQPA